MHAQVQPINDSSAEAERCARKITGLVLARLLNTGNHRSS